MFLATNYLFSQTPSGIAIGWDKNVGCQVFSDEIKPRVDPVFIEDFAPDVCITVCENSIINYTLTGNFTSSPSTSWSINGGTINSSTFSTANVTWGIAGLGSLSFSTLTPNGIITKTICFTKVLLPSSAFNVVPAVNNNDDIRACTKQTIYFTNTSTTNGGSGLYSYDWDFGDNTPHSAAFEPTHIYTNASTFTITLIVTNSCGCTSTFTRKIRVSKNGIDISCPSVMCDGQSAQYRIPASAVPSCVDFNWSVMGGTINSVNYGILNVTWDNVDATGFGYVTFDPVGCNIPCRTPTTIKIPVIKSVGDIIGNSFICLGEQARYVLPQWPTTDFTWEIVNNNVLPHLAQVIQTDQRNEIIIEPNFVGTITLKCTYVNTLLHCGGSATFDINVIEPITIDGPTRLCKNTTGNYSIVAGQVADWQLKDSAGNVIYTATNSNAFSYNYTIPGNYQLSLVGTPGAPQCGTSVLNITIVNMPAIVASAIVGDRNNICPTAPYTYTIQNPTPGTEYVWSVPSGGTFDGATVGNSVTIRFDAAATHQIIVFNRTLAPLVCNSPPTTITVNTLQINAQITDNLSVVVCPNNSEPYQINNLGSTQIYNSGDTYFWSITPAYLGSVIANQGTNAATILWNNVLQTTPAVLSVVINKCTLAPTTLTKGVTITPVPAIVVTPRNNNVVVSSICSGAQVNFAVTATNGFVLAPNSTVIWDFGNGVTQTTNGLNYNYTYSNLSVGDVDYTITVKLVNPNNCTGTTIATVPLRINPGPEALISVLSGGNAFCPNVTITTVLKATSSTTGVTYKWYKSGNSTLLGISNQLNINNSPNYGFGTYYFIARNAAGCETTSTLESVSELQCDPPYYCTVSPNPVVTNTSYITNYNSANCASRQIILSGVTTPTPLSVKWDIVGPAPFYTSDFTGTSIGTSAIPLTPGVYNIVKKVVFTCTNGQLAIAPPETVSLVIPYLANFVTGISCQGSNNYTVNLIDTSPFFSLVPVGSRTFYYYRATVSNSGVVGAYTLVATTANATFTNQSAGNYKYKLVIRGSIYNSFQPNCEIIKDVNITPQLQLNIDPVTVACHDSAVQFGITNPFLTGYTYLWNFDAGASSTLKNPLRVFTNSGPQTASVVVKDNYGCEQVLSVAFTVPNKCFNGNIVANPNNPANVCLGNAFNLQYIPAAGECQATSFIWMNGKDPIATTATGNYNVTAPGFYWVKVKSVNDCTYETPGRITPTFRPLPTLQMAAIGTVCNARANASITTNAPIISWVLDNINQPIFNNLAAANFSNLSVGNHTLTVNAKSAPLDGGCVKTATQIFTVLAPIPLPTISTQLLSCVPFKVQLTASNSLTGYYNWTNGQNGASIEVTSGGAYGVSFTSNGCTSFAQTDIPKNAEIYLWSFPTGCYSGCNSTNDMIIGPQLPIGYSWQYLQNLNTIAQGTGNVDPITLTQSGTYNLNINNSLCDFRSRDLSYQTQNCRECKLKLVVKDVKVIDPELCINQVSLEILNYSGSSITGTITNPSNQVLIVSSGITLINGYNYPVINFIPINGFQGGNVTIVITGVGPEGNICTVSFVIRIFGCVNNRLAGNSSATSKQLLATDLTIAPNPAKNSTTISFSNTATAPLLEVYDLLGKSIMSYQTTSNNDSWSLDTTTIAAGIYVVALREEGVIMMQKKLIIE